MNRAMLAGLSGTLANQTYIDVLGNDIANANTIGFKEQRATFQDAFYDTLSGGRSGGQAGVGGMNPAQVGSGTSVGQVQVIHTQGAMQYSGAPLDAAIEGAGMFVLDNGAGGTLYTRDGSFILDDTQTLISGGSGMAVMGWMGNNGTVTATGAPTRLTFPIGEVSPGKVTSKVTMGGNLDASLPVASTNTATVSVYDSLGASHPVTLTFTRTATANQWTVTATSGASTATGTLNFSAANGSLTSGSPLAFSLAVTSGAASPVPVSLDLSQITQLNQTGSSVVALSQDGSPSSTLSDVSILEGGEVQGQYSDGHVQTLAQVALANFANVGGLVQTGTNLYQPGANSGQITIGAANTGGRGQVRSRQLEMSNVDLTKSFVEIMTAQRGFQASTKVISASNQMLDTVMQLNVG